MTAHVPIERFLDAARAAVERVAARVPLRSAVLDRWGGAVRIVYGCDAVERCGATCEGCALHAAVGEDLGPAAPDELRTTLRRASPRQLETFSARQRMMNCKTLGQYADAFVEWLVHRCLDRASLEAELDLALGFRLLLEDGRPATADGERRLRSRILSDAIGHPLLDPERRGLVEDLLDRRRAAGLLRDGSPR